MIDAMLERIREIWARLRPDPAKTSLGWWMVAIHVAIVLLVGGGISYSAIRMLHDLADDQGKSRVQLAGAMARERNRSSKTWLGIAVAVGPFAPLALAILGKYRDEHPAPTN